MNEDLVPLVRRFQDGDVQAFEALVDRFSGVLARFVGHMVPDRSRAEDLLQSLWLKAWTHRQALQDPAKIKAWLYRIAHREVLMHLRTKEAVQSLDEGMDEEPSGGGAAPEEALVREEDAGRVMEGFVGLPPLYKEVVWLAVVEELPHAQIARILDIPEGTCRSRLHHGLGKLRTIIENRKSS